MLKLNLQKDRYRIDIIDFFFFLKNKIKFQIDLS